MRYLIITLCFVLCTAVISQADGTPTTNYGFIKPTDGGDTGQWGADLNNSFDTMDSTIKGISDSVDGKVDLGDEGIDTTGVQGLGYLSDTNGCVSQEQLDGKVSLGDEGIDTTGVQGLGYLSDTLGCVSPDEISGFLSDTIGCASQTDMEATGDSIAAISGDTGNNFDTIAVDTINFSPTRFGFIDGTTNELRLNATGNVLVDLNQANGIIARSNNNDVLISNNTAGGYAISATNNDSMSFNCLGNGIFMETDDGSVLEVSDHIEWTGANGQQMTTSVDGVDFTLVDSNDSLDIYDGVSRIELAPTRSVFPNNVRIEGILSVPEIQPSEDLVVKASTFTDTTIQTPDIDNAGNINSIGSITTSSGSVNAPVGNIVGAIVTSTGDMSVGGSISITEACTAAFFYGDGSKLTGISGGASGDTNGFDTMNVSDTIFFNTDKASIGENADDLKISCEEGISMFSVNNGVEFTIADETFFEIGGTQQLLITGDGITADKITGDTLTPNDGDTYQIDGGLKVDAIQVGDATMYLTPDGITFPDGTIQETSADTEDQIYARTIVHRLADDGSSSSTSAFPSFKTHAADDNRYHLWSDTYETFAGDTLYIHYALGGRVSNAADSYYVKLRVHITFEGGDTAQYFSKTYVGNQTSRTMYYGTIEMPKADFPSGDCEFDIYHLACTGTGSYSYTVYYCSENLIFYYRRKE